MSHPYKQHREDKVGKSRASRMVKGYARGGKSKHPDAAEDKKMIAGMIGAHEAKMHGSKSKPRLDKFARGGAAKKKGAVNININLNQKKDDELGGLPPVPPIGNPAAPIPPPAPPMPPMGGPPGGPPGMPMGGPPGMMKRGGAVKVKMKGGAESGVGRLDKIKAYGKKNRG